MCKIAKWQICIQSIDADDIAEKVGITQQRATQILQDLAKWQKLVESFDAESDEERKRLGEEHMATEKARAEFTEDDYTQEILPVLENFPKPVASFDAEDPRIISCVQD